jgi:hypothetical protein
MHTRIANKGSDGERLAPKRAPDLLTRMEQYISNRETIYSNREVDLEELRANTHSWFLKRCDVLSSCAFLISF